MRRREFIALLGSASVGWPLSARAEKPEPLRLLGVLMDTAESDPLGQQRVAALRGGLQELGWGEADNLQIDLRWYAGDANRHKDYTAELVRLAPDVLVTNGTAATSAMEQATHSIPIVFAVVNDPVEQGLIASLAHPGGNVTGFSFVDFPLFGKSLGLLRQIAPKATRIGLMFRPLTTRTTTTVDHPWRDCATCQFSKLERLHALQLNLPSRPLVSRRGRDVVFWHFADIETASIDVRIR